MSVFDWVSFEFKKFVKTRDTVASFLSASALLRRVDIVAHHGFTGVHIASAYAPDDFFYQFLSKGWIVLNAGLYRLFEITCKCHISMVSFIQPDHPTPRLKRSRVGGIYLLFRTFDHSRSVKDIPSRHLSDPPASPA